MGGTNPSFTSDRERRLWLWVLFVIVAIYSTLGLAGTTAAELRERSLLGVSFAIGFVLVIAAIVGTAATKKRRPSEIWAILGIVAVYGMIAVRMGLSPEERTHLFEYGLLAVLIHQALSERARNGRRVPVPAVVAIAMTALLGWLDEGLQALIPNRVYDLRDVGINSIAGLMAIVASVIITRVRERAVRRDTTEAPLSQ